MRFPGGSKIERTMMHKLLMGVVVATAGLTGTGTAQQPFRADVSLVHLPVVVLDRQGAPVTGLAPGDFEVIEDGRPQQVTAFAAGETGDLLPFYLGLMLDRSMSMAGDLRAAADAAVRFVNALDEARDVTFVDFDTNVRVGRFSPASYPHLFARIREQRPGGETALYDAVGTYVETAMAREGLHVLLLYSDGGDSRSSLGIGDLQALLRRGNVLVYVVGYLERQSSSTRFRQQSTLTSIARETGGEAFFPGSARDLDGIYERILTEIRSRYTLGYRSSHPSAGGEFRRVEVRVTRPDAGRVRVRTRSGYVVPEAGR